MPKNIVSTITLWAFYTSSVLLHEQYPQLVDLVMVFTWVLCFIMLICLILFSSLLFVLKSGDIKSVSNVKPALLSIQQGLKSNSSVCTWLTPIIIIGSLAWMGLVVTLFVYAFFVIVLRFVADVIKGGEYV